MYDVWVTEIYDVLVRVEADGCNEAREKAHDAAELRLPTEGNTCGATTEIVDVYGAPPDNRAGIDLDTTKKEAEDGDGDTKAL